MEKLRKILVILLLLLVVLGSGCNNKDGNSKQTPAPTPTLTPTPTIETPPEPSPDSKTKLAAFNLQAFGTTKANKSEVMEVLSKIIRNYDIIAVQEIRDATQTALPKLKNSTNAMGGPQGEGDFIVMGDLNADCSYFKENGSSPLRSSDYLWLIDNSVDTTTKSSVCTYDRIIITTPAETDFTGESGVFRFDVEYNLTPEQTTAVSDHYPVYAEFWKNKDND